MELLYLAKLTQLQMVQDRGFSLNPLEQEMLQWSSGTFSQRLQGQDPRAHLHALYRLGDRTLLVYFGSRNGKKQVSKELATTFVAAALQHQATEAILIVDGPLSTGADEAVTPLHPQVFQEIDMVYNPIYHVDNPAYRLLTTTEVSALLNHMKVSASRIPIILLSDPVVKYYGWPVGSIVRIDRDDSELNLLAPLSLNYRCVTA
jgi:DNA-directed RNA polymerase subunit H (RpoH/RPB5)